MADMPRFPVPTYVTSLPTSPYDGQEVYYVASATDGVIWHLRYNAGSASAYKWECVGGSEMFSEVTTGETTTSSTYVALTTAGPSITIPLAGDFDVWLGGDLRNATVNCWAQMSYDIGATGALDIDGVTLLEPGSGFVQVTVSRKRRKTGLAASTALVAKYKQALGGTARFENRWMGVRPIRVG